jgi:hypothetical protein
MKIERSSKKDKKFMVRSPSGKLVHFAQRGYGDFHMWQLARGMKFALKKRYRYVKSHKAILLKDGTPAWKSPESPEFYSTRATWEYPRGNSLFKQVVAIRNKGLSKDEKAFIAKQKKLKK